MFGGTGVVGDVDAVACLHSAVSELASRELTGHTDAEVVGLWQELETLRNRLAVLDHRLIGEVQSRRLPAAAGCKSTAVFVQQVLRVGIGQARRRVNAADALGPRQALTGEALPPIYARLADASAAGEISPAAATVVVDTIEKLPDAVRASEDTAVETSLVGQARVLHLDNLKTVAQRVIALLDPDGMLRDEEYRRRHREVHLQQRASGGPPANEGVAGGGGSGRLSGECTAELTERLRAVFDTLARPQPETDSGKDPRSAGQRRHDTLLDATTLLTRTEQLPDCGGVSTTALVIMDEHAIRTGDGIATTGHGATISATEAIRWLDGGGQVLPIWRDDTNGAVIGMASKCRIFTEKQRLAMIVRDHGCAFPGCDAPAQYCEAHHVVPWANGGPTSLGNGCLLCAYHHREFENLGWRCSMIDRVPYFTPPPWHADRTPIRNHAHDPTGLPA